MGPASQGLRGHSTSSLKRFDRRKSAACDPTVVEDSTLRET